MLKITIENLENDLLDFDLSSVPPEPYWPNCEELKQVKYLTLTDPIKYPLEDILKTFFALYPESRFELIRIAVKDRLEKHIKELLALNVLSIDSFDTVQRFEVYREML